jgi:hypothetical protein
MPCPHGADFFWRGEFAACNFGFCLGEVGFFLRRQLDRRLIDARKLQHNSRQLVLPSVWQGGHRAEGFLKKTGHNRSIPNNKAPAKPGPSEISGRKTDQRE